MATTFRPRRARPVVMFLAILLALTAIAPGSTDAQTWVQTHWGTSLHLNTTFTTAEAGPAQLALSTPDSLDLYLNGSLIASGATTDGWQAIPVTLLEGINIIGARVASSRRVAGNGLALAVDTDSQRVATSDVLVQPWVWSQAPEDATWQTQDMTGADGWQLAQLSPENPAPAGAPVNAPPAVAGFPGQVDPGSAAGGLILAQVRGQNLALHRPSNRVEAVDGDLRTAWEPPVSSINFAASIDLQERRKIDRVRVLTEGPDFEANSLRGYSVQVSDNQIRWSEVGVVHDITDFEGTEVRFNPTFTRYVRVVIVDITAVSSPKIAEIQVYGEGYIEQADYLSPVLDLGEPALRKNIGRVFWEADVPARTELSLQFRSGNVAEDFADTDEGWSDRFVDDGIWFPTKEPAALLQYRVRMRTRDELSTPRLQSLRIDFETDIAATSARGAVTPTRIPIGVDTMFVYDLALDIGAEDAGVDRVDIAIPSVADVDAAGVTGASLASWSSTQKVLTLRFAETLRTSTSLRIPFRSRSFSSSHRFQAALFAAGSLNPLNGEAATAEDPAGQISSWTVLTTTTGVGVLTGVRANPAVLTPNGDGINDLTVIEMVLAKVDTPRRITVGIHDLSGRVVRQLEVPALVAGTYQRIVGAEPDSPAVWDGRNGAGELVPPGTYLFRVEVQLDDGDVADAGSVAVVY